jgi:hypothetical protein
MSYRERSIQNTQRLASILIICYHTAANYSKVEYA